MVTLQNPPSTTLAPGTDVVGIGTLSNRWVGYAPAAVMAVSFVPILLLHGSELWARPHYQFFPLVVPGAIALVWRWCGTLGRVDPGNAALGSGLAVLAWLMLAAAIACISPGLGALAALVALLGAAYSLGGWKLTIAALPAWALLWLAIPPPKHLDVVLIVKLQNLVSRWSSRILDLIGVYHMMDGNVVDVGGRPLLVDQACSGVYSLVTLLIGTLFYILWVRTSWLRACILLASAVVWVIFGNLARIVLVVLLSTRFGIDAATGWKHEAIGMVVFCVLLGLVLSTDRLVTFVTALGRWSVANVLASTRGRAASRVVRKPPSALDTLNLSRGSAARARRSRSEAPPVTAPTESPALAPMPAPQPEPSIAASSPTEAAGPTVLPGPSQTWVGSWRVAAAFGVLFVPQLFMPGARWKEVLLASDVYNTRFASIKADAMPKNLNGLEQIKFEEIDRSKDNTWGEHSKFWLYSSPVGLAVVSLDYDFVDWHELTDCYRAQGWTMTSRKILTAPAPDLKPAAAGSSEPQSAVKVPPPLKESSSGGPIVAAEFLNPDGRSKYLLFGMYDRRGRPKEPIDARSLGSVLSARFQSWFRTGDSGDSDADVHCYQLQVFVDTDASLNEAGKQSMLGLLARAREQVEAVGLKHKTAGGDAR